MNGCSCCKENELSRMVALYESNEELEEMFNDRFMKKYTNYNSFEEFRSPEQYLLIEFRFYCR